MFAPREFLLCEKQKAKAFSSCQSPSFVMPGNQASSSTCCLQKITAKELLWDLFKKPEICSRTGIKLGVPVKGKSLSELLDPSSCKQRLGPGDFQRVFQYVLIHGSVVGKHAVLCSSARIAGRFYTTAAVRGEKVHFRSTALSGRWAALWA